MTRSTIRTLASALVAAAIIAILAAGTSWRLALVAALAASAIAMTRLRYAAVAAIALLAITLALAQTGRSAGSDDRNAPAHTYR